ncbi:TauD/TfdA family dioxygenase [Chitinophaga sp. Cy-1792]|uniref:TauD/TfdA family dioxygenase n=1 Tax=Chitinophaga sp. Cy-1792 TaxID=2608339 RepID=UPI0014205DE0|nr:TauD/TfdA family dioxygenase [Chitinophaga sp. Cy-1792]NIG56236.1 taurine catabolism dioxygenase TauD [Chitinophaga sp. Cy-1792]
MEKQIFAQENTLKRDWFSPENPPLNPAIVIITAIERLELERIGRSLRKQYGSYESPEYIDSLHLNAYKILPESIARALMRMGTDFSASQYGAVVFRGLIDVDQEALGPTPSSWQEIDKGKIMEYGFICSLLHGAVPSKPVEYYVQRKGGGLMHAIIPDINMAYSQTGSGSKTELFVHTEDAFLFNAADFLSFLFLRNDEKVPSMLYSIRSHGKPGEAMKPLFEEVFKCPKDANFSQQDATGDAPHASILYGNPEAPFIRFDAAEQIFNEDAGQSPEALEHLQKFWNEAQGLIYDEFIPEAGDLIFVNNHLCAHGRNAFTAGFKQEGDQLVPCERRMMLRMMSKTSLIHIQPVAHPQNPYLVMEEHYGKIYPATISSTL